MNAFRFVVVFAIVAGMIGTHDNARAGLFTYTTGIQVQNVENVLANITLKYYDLDGSQVMTATDTIQANNSRTYFPIHAAVGFAGSAVIESNTRIATIVNVLGNNGAAAASYVAPSQGSTTVLLPLLLKSCSGYLTWFNVQNVGDADATVNVAYSDGMSAGPVVIKPGSVHTFDQTIETHSVKVFSAIVTSDQPITAVVIEESRTVLFAYSGFSAGSTEPLMPLINNGGGAGYITGIQIQNGGITDTLVTVSYIPSSVGTGCTETQTILAGQSRTFALAAFYTGENSTCVPRTKFVGSARVTSNSTGQPLTAIVNQLKGSLNGEAYSSFDIANAGESVVFPLIMDNNAGYYTGFNVMNVGVTTSTVTCEFTNSTYTVTATLKPGQALNDLQARMSDVRYVGSATCNAPGGQIVGVLNELGPSGNADQLLVYEGINPQGPSSSTRSYVPLLYK
jgi:hypothetical protein